MFNKASFQVRYATWCVCLLSYVHVRPGGVRLG